MFKVFCTEYEDLFNSIEHVAANAENIQVDSFSGRCEARSLKTIQEKENNGHYFSI